MNRKRMNKLFVALLVLTFLLCLTLPFSQINPVYAAESYLLGYSESNRNECFFLCAIHPSVDSWDSAVSQSFKGFTNNSYNRLTKVEFYLSKIGSPIGHYVACLYLATGTYGSSNVPSGTPLATSMLNHLEDISTTFPTFSLVSLTFDEANQYVMSPNIVYTITIQIYNATTLDITNRLLVGSDDTAPTDPGNAAEFYENTWHNIAVEDLCFGIYGVTLDHYNFYGLFDESTGLLKPPSERAVNVTAYYTGGEASETFTVNGTYFYYYTAVPLYFHYDLGDKSREYWVNPGETTLNLYIFNETLTSYTVKFMDLAGILKSYPYVEVKRYINGTLITVEKRKVDAEQKGVFSIKLDIRYTIIIGGEGASYTFGDVIFVSTLTNSITLTLKGIEFPQDIILAYQYNRIYAYRHDNQTKITIVYQDVKQRLANVKINILFENGSSVSAAYPYWYYNVYEFTHLYSSAIYNTTYIVKVTIYHVAYGEMHYNAIFARSWTTQPWKLPFGTIPGFNIADLFPLIIIFACFLIFSQINVPIACFIGTAMAIILTWFGWIYIPSGLLIAAVVFDILIGMAHARKRG